MGINYEKILQCFHTFLTFHNLNKHFFFLNMFYNLIKDNFNNFSRIMPILHDWYKSTIWLMVKKCEGFEIIREETAILQDDFCFPEVLQEQ